MSVLLNADAVENHHWCPRGYRLRCCKNFPVHRHPLGIRKLGVPPFTTDEGGGSVYCQPLGDDRLGSD
jgi:hypothetical protein